MAGIRLAPEDSDLSQSRTPVAGDLVSDDDRSIAADSWSIKSGYGSTVDDDQRHADASDALAAAGNHRAASDYRNMNTTEFEDRDNSDVEDSDNSDEERDQDIQDLVIVGLRVISYYARFCLRTPCRTSKSTGQKLMMDILAGNDIRCHEMFRMEKHVFIKLCDKIQMLGFQATRGISLHEAVGMFLMTLGHGVGNRLIQESFQHSSETVSRQFTNVLKYVSLLGSEMIKPIDDYNKVPYHIRQNSKYWPYFRDCIGAIDGTHVRLTLPLDEQNPYIGRKGYPTTNIMAECDFNMKFTFVWPGWEGSANDTHIFLEALRDPQLKFPKPPNDKYYLVDSGYPNMKGYLAPYKGERYHLPEFRNGSQPRGPKEIFNKAHSSLRSVIERTFGVWKARWIILKRMPSYKYDKQIAIIAASMTLHNFIRTEAIADIEFPSFENEDHIINEGNASEPERIMMDESEMGITRDNIARELFSG